MSCGAQFILLVTSKTSLVVSPSISVSFLSKQEWSVQASVNVLYTHTVQYLDEEENGSPTIKTRFKNRWNFPFY